MTTFIDRWRRTIVIAIVIGAAAGAAFWLRARSSNVHHEADRSVVAGSETVASPRIDQLPPPPPRLPDEPRPPEEERTLPEGWNKHVRSAPAESVQMRMPAPGEEAPVRAHRFVPGQQPPPSQPRSPFVPPKQHLSEEDLRAGLAE